MTTAMQAAPSQRFVEHGDPVAIQAVDLVKDYGKNIGSRLKLWKMNPMSCLRSIVSCLSFKVVRSTPWNMMWPDVALSKPRRPPPR